MVQIYIVILLSALLVLGALSLLLRTRIVELFYDIPNHRKVHSRLVPRMGGLGILFSFFLVYFSMMCLGIVEVRPISVSLLSAVFVFGAIGIMDDSQVVKQMLKRAAWELRPRYKLLIEFALASVVISFIPSVIPGFGVPMFIEKPLLVIWLVGVANAFNIIDGIDGLCGGVSLLTFTVLAALGFASNTPEVMWPALILAGTTVGFLVLNWNPAKLFLGDMGSLFFGFSAAVLGLVMVSETHAQGSPMTLVYLAGYPIFEVALSIARRFSAPAPGATLRARISKIVVADANHFHHRLLAAGHGHRGATMRLVILQGAFLSAGVALIYWPLQQSNLLVHGVICLVMAGAVTLAYSQILQKTLATQSWFRVFATRPSKSKVIQRHV